jgi:hypothetical protein
MSDELSEQEEAVEETAEDKRIDPLTLFPSNIQKAVEGLMYIGQLTETVSFCGHRFGLRTLRPQHKYAIAQVLQPYRNTIMEVDIFQNATVATALTHVDGKHDFCPPIGPEIESFVAGRLNYVSNNETGWFPQTLEFLWARYVLLEATATEAIAELHRLSQRSQPITSSPWLDSLAEQGRTIDETNLAFQPSTISNWNS